KYLARSMRQHLDALEYHGELGFNRDYYSRRVRMELLAMSAASIDRYLRRFRASAKRAAPVVRSSISTSDLGTLFDPEPGFVECDVLQHGDPSHGGLGHCDLGHADLGHGHSTARTLNMTYVQTGWTYTRTMYSGTGMDTIVTASIDPAHGVPFALTRVDFNHGNEQLRRVCAAWAERHGIHVSQLRPIMRDDVNSHSKSHHM